MIFDSFILYFNLNIAIFIIDNLKSINNTYLYAT